MIPSVWPQFSRGGACIVRTSASGQRVSDAFAAVQLVIAVSGSHIGQEFFRLTIPIKKVVVQVDIEAQVVISARGDLQDAQAFQFQFLLSSAIDLVEDIGTEVVFFLDTVRTVAALAPTPSIS